MPDPHAERLSTWIDEDLMQALRVYATLENTTQRQVIERALREWMDRNPLDVEGIVEAVDRAVKGKEPDPIG